MHLQRMNGDNLHGMAVVRMKPKPSERINGCGGHGICHGGHDGRGGGHSTSGNCNTRSIELDRNVEQPDASTGQQQQSGNGDCGAQHGCGSGHGGCLPVSLNS